MPRAPDHGQASAAAARPRIRARRAISSRPARTSLTAPMPWPQPQMSFQALRRVAAEVHLARVALGQVVGVEAGVADRALQVVAVHAGEQVAVDDVVELPSTIICL
jgi:hypothetical protein